jgi:hypothetical protein
MAGHRAVTVHRPVLVTLNAVVILALTSAMLGGMIPILAQPSSASPYAFFGALALWPLLLAFGVVVWRSAFAKSKPATDVATVLYFVGAALTVFGVVANVGEAIADETQPDTAFIVWFVVVGLLVAAYATFSGFLSLRWGRRLQAEGRHNAAGGAGGRK